MTYTTIVTFGPQGFKKEVRNGVLASTEKPEIAVEALKKALKHVHPSWVIESLEIFETPSDHLIDFFLLISGAAEVDPVCQIKWPNGGYRSVHVTDPTIKELLGVL